MGEAVKNMPLNNELAIEIEQRFELVNEARLMWDALSDFRSRRQRSRNYYRGKPNEKFFDENTQTLVDEDEYIESQGRVPYKMNQIAPVIRNLKGQFRQNKTQRMAYGRNRDDNDASEMMTEALRFVSDVNQCNEVDTDQFEEELISGLYGWKLGFKWDRELNRNEVSIDPIDVNRMFFNADFKDRRAKDLRVIGEIHDITLDSLVAQFAKTKAHEEWLRDRYARYTQESFWNMQPDTGFKYSDRLDFFMPANPSMCRVIESWRLEYRWQTFYHDPVTGTYDILTGTKDDVQKLNQMRLMEAMQVGLEPPEPITTFDKYEGVWKSYFLTPFGEVLFEKDTPYWHEAHPFIMGFATLLDGEFWGMIEDIIDPQRLINRITTSIDYMFGAASKGVLLIPEEAIPEHMNVDDFASEWTKFNGVIAYKAKNLPNGHVPHQVVSNSVPSAIFNWLGKMEDNLRKQSGVEGAATGEAPTANTPASLYETQVIQSQTNNRDFFDSFFEVRRQRDRKVCKLIAQYYDTPTMLTVSGKRVDGKKMIRYTPTKVRGIDFDIVMSDTADTPAVRQLMEDYLTGMLQQNRLTFRQYLEVSSHPKADMILRLIEKTNPELANQQVNPQAMQQLQMAAQNGDRDAMATLAQAQ